MNSAKNKKVLIASYIFPPAGGSGAQRIINFARYLPQFGYEPVILTVENPPEGNIDIDLLEKVSPDLKVVRTRTFEPDNFDDPKLTLKNFTLKNFKNKMIRNYFRFFDFTLIPDEKIGWVKRSVKRGIKLIEEDNIEAVITSGPPYSTHILGLNLKQQTGIKWIADFRDGWTQFSPHFQPHLKRFLKHEEKMEKKVIEGADAVVAVAENILKGFAEKYPDCKERVHLITNGFESEDFSLAEKFSDKKLEDYFASLDKTQMLIVHTGSLYAQRNPCDLLKALKELYADNALPHSAVKVLLVGSFDRTVREMLADSAYKEFVKVHNFVSHRDSIQCIMRSDLLLLIVDNVAVSDRIYTGKIFEYLGSGKPVIALSPLNSPAASLITKAGTGKVFKYGDIDELKKELLSAYELFKKGALKTSPETKFISSFERKKLTGRLAEILGEIIS